jgi:hypothetical protein
VIVDFDNNDRVVGLEVLALSKRLPQPKMRKHPRNHKFKASLVQEKPTKKYGAKPKS